MMMVNTVLLIVFSVVLTSRTSSAWMHPPRPTTSLLMSRLSPSSSTNNFRDLRCSSRVSGFGGQVLLLQTDNVPPSRTADATSTTSETLNMKKGKPNVPPMMRKQYERQKEMMEMRREMIESSKPGGDGLPIFNLYVRTKRQKMWYPCGSFKGDERSGGLAKNYADKNLMAGLSKSQLDNGISGSLFKDLAKLTDSICRAYPQLRKSKGELEWGYRLAYPGLDEKTEPIYEVEPKEQKGIIDNIKGMFGG